MNDQKNSDEIAKLMDEIKELREDIDQSYYRVPKKEFENIIKENITQEVSDKFNKRITTWRNWAGFVIIILSYFGITMGGKYFTKMEEDIKKEVVNELDTKFNAAIDKSFEQGITKIESRMEEKFSSIAQKLELQQSYQKKESERIEKDIIKMSSLVDTKVDRAVSNFKEINTSAITAGIKYEFEILNKEVGDGSKTYEEGLNEINSLIERAIEFDNKKLISQLLDKMFLWNYKTLDYESMDKLAFKYETEYKFSYASWATIAIADIMLYEETNADNYKKRALSAISKSLEILPDYGTAYAAELLLNTLDYDRENNLNKKEGKKSKIINLVNSINAGRKNITSYETYAWLLKVEQVVYLKKYFEMLNFLFPEGMKKMETRYWKYKDDNNL